MKREQALRVAAICTSVALVAGYVVWRSIGAASGTAQPGSPAVAGQPAGGAPTLPVAEPPEMFMGSKSAPVMPTRRDPTMMGGSKRMEIIEPKDLESPAEEMPKPASPGRQTTTPRS